jgi:nitrogen fixation-related uncharacterized protein
MKVFLFWIVSVVELSPSAPDTTSAQSTAHVQGSWFGIGDGTVILWPLVWTLLPIGIFAILALLWATKTGQFQNAQDIAERQLEIED